MEPILQVRDLRTSFLTSNGEVKAVRGVSFDVEKGRTLGLRPACFLLSGRGKKPHTRFLAH